MATSGTVATTTIDTATLLEHAFRRVGKLANEQTPETITIAQNALFFLLTHLTNRGLNLWCVEKAFIGLEDGCGGYSAPAGTIDILNVVYSDPTLLSVTTASTADGMSAQLAAAQEVLRVGFKPTAAFTGSIAIKHSTDGVTYTTLTTLDSQTYAAGKWYWADLPTATSDVYFSVAATSLTVTDMRLISAIADTPITQWNRDTWAVLNNKFAQGHPSTNYYLERHLTPKLNLWPVPDNDEDHITIFRHRQVQDIGTLPQQIEIPVQWYEGIIWQLALRLGFELPDVAPERLQLVAQMSDKYQFEDEINSTDGAPIYITPGIGAYTR